MFSGYIALALAIGIGWAVRKYGHARIWPVIPASIASSALFYINHEHRLLGFRIRGYQKTFAGLVQSLTSGLPGYAPTWMFFRATL